MKELTRYKPSLERVNCGSPVNMENKNGDYILYEDFKKFIEDYVRYEDFKKLQEALIDIRDYNPGHCMGDFGTQATNIIDNTNETLDEVKDLL